MTDPNALLIAQHIATSQAAAWGLGIAQTVRRVLHTNTMHGERTQSYAWIYEQIKKKIASDPSAQTATLLCGDYSALMYELCGLLGLTCRVVRSATRYVTIPNSPYRNYQDHVLVEVWHPVLKKWIVQDADFGVEYNSPTGVPLSLADLAMADDFMADCIPTDNIVTGWVNNPGRNVAAIPVTDVFSTVDHYSGNCIIFGPRAEPEALYLVVGAPNTPRTLRDIVISTATQSVKPVVIG